MTKNKNDNLIYYVVSLVLLSLVFIYSTSQTLFENEIKINEISLIVTGFISIVLLYSFSILVLNNHYKKTFKMQENSLDEKIEEKTKDIQFAMRELEKMNVKLYDLAHTDLLTKAMNRRNFFINAQNAFIIAKKHNYAISSVIISINDFKILNDKYGYKIGDKILRTFARTIKENTKDDTIFGRLAGEEFALVFIHDTEEEAKNKMLKIKKEFEKNSIITNDDEKINITITIGISDNEKSENIDEMLQKANLEISKDRLSIRARA